MERFGHDFDILSEQQKLQFNIHCASAAFTTTQASVNFCRRSSEKFILCLVWVERVPIAGSAGGHHGEYPRQFD